MHDPMTQAFVIPWRWRTEKFSNGKPWRYWVPLITIWHKDPERRGNADSCGWFTPPFSETTREIVKSLAGDEARDPWFMAMEAKTNPNPILCERLVFGAFMLVSLCLKNCGVLWREVTVAEATRWAAEMTHSHIDNFRSSLCFLSGYHSNWYKQEQGIPNTVKEDEFWREENARSFFGAIAGKILRERRFWFQKPKWHIWHWELQVHPAQSFKRWAFSRCSKCGKGFSWGYSPCTGNWHGTGPRWFRSEQGVYHQNCMEPSKEQVGQVVAAGKES